MKKGWRTPFSFKITPRRARRTGLKALFVSSLAKKLRFFAKLGSPRTRVCGVRGELFLLARPPALTEADVLAIIMSDDISRHIRIAEGGGARCPADQ